MGGGGEGGSMGVQKTTSEQEKNLARKSGILQEQLRNCEMRGGPE